MAIIHSLSCGMNIVACEWVLCFDKFLFLRMLSLQTWSLEGVKSPIRSFFQEAGVPNSFPRDMKRGDYSPLAAEEMQHSHSQGMLLEFREKNQPTLVLMSPDATSAATVKRPFSALRDYEANSVRAVPHAAKQVPNVALRVHGKFSAMFTLMSVCAGDIL